MNIAWDAEDSRDSKIDSVLEQLSERSNAQQRNIDVIWESLIKFALAVNYKEGRKIRDAFEGANPGRIV